MSGGGSEAADTSSATPHSGVVTLRDLVAEPSLGVRLAGADADLDRPVSYVYQTELDDPSTYLTGDELILTVGMPLLDEQRTADYVAVLSGCRVTAVGLGLGERFAETPSALISACAAAELPLLTVAAGRPFRAVVEWIARRRDEAREQGDRERELGALLAWCASGTLGPLPTEDLLARYGLVGEPVLVSAFSLSSHERVHGLGLAADGAVAVMQDVVLVLRRYSEQHLSFLRATGLSCGVSVARDASALSSAIPEAVEALGVARRSAGMVHARDTVTLEGLLAAVPSMRLVPFVQHFVVPLVDYDTVHRTQLVATLQAFLDNSGNPAAVATALYVHVNTLRNRMLKIGEVTGVDPYVEENRIGYRVGLWAAGRLGPARPGSAGRESPA